MTPLERWLWVLAGILANVAIWGLVTTVVFGTPAESPTPARFSPSSVPTRSPSPTRIPSATSTISPTPFPTLSPLVIPTPPAEGVSLTFSPNPDRTGWIGSKELGPHWRDRNLYSGTYLGQSIISVLQFDLRSLAPGSQILFAALELTGRDAQNLGTSGEWRLELIDANSTTGWDDVSYDAVQQVPPLAVLGKPIVPRELAAGLTNRFVFTPSQLKLVQDQINIGTLNLRLVGPTDQVDNMFSWEAARGAREPTLYIVAVPAAFVVITPTPTPADVFAAATLAVQQTRQVQQVGTPTSLPRGIVTATPGGDSAAVVVTNTPTPLNEATQTFRSAYATAEALTTGTATPVPLNWITATPLPTATPTPTATPVPLFIPVKSFTPTSTPTPTPVQQLFPATLYNKILFLSGSRSAPSVWAMDPDGKNLGLITDRSVYDRAAARDVLSPNGAFQLYNASDQNFYPDSLQIWSQFLNRPPMPPQRLTALQKGIAYAPSWSPVSYKIAYTSSETGKDEIWILDMNTQKGQRITNSTDWYWNQHPSWSPNGQQITFASDRFHTGSFTEIWIMDANGGGEHLLGDGTHDAWAPVWVKWRQ